MPRALRLLPAAFILIATASLAAAQAPSTYADMQWRTIGPTRAGRARALSGVPGQSNVFYAGFDNGGVWRSTDFGSTWHPIFDQQSTGSIGAIAVAPSDPNVIYVGTGAGIIRPDLSTGDGVYRSTDAGKSWTNVGLTDTRMIAWIAVDPKDPNRVFVAALGHPYGPNAERGIFRSTDGGHTWQKVLYKDEYTSGNVVVIDPADPSIVYASLWRQQQSFREGDEFGGAGNGIYKSTDGGTTWTQLTTGLPDVIEANLAIAPSDPSHLYAMVAGAAPAGARDRGDPTTGVVGFYTSTDGGEHWVGIDAPGVPSDTSTAADPRPLARIGGGDLPTVTVDPKDPKVVYSSSVVLWRTLDGGHAWSAVRGAPGGDDYQNTWIDPNDPNILFVVSDQGAVVSANRGVSWSNWYTQPTAAMYHVTTDNAFPNRDFSVQQDSGSGCVDSRSMDGEITFHDWHPVNIQEYGMAAPDPRQPDMVYGSGRTGISLYDRRTGQTTHLGPDQTERGTDYGRNVRTMPLIWSPVDSNALFYASNVVWKSL
ncbi:MAG: WD40/YVTN/BNR-like repeat-containing protein, partial [Gemmatimonadales bacterium]